MVKRALRNLFSPTLGVDRSEPVLAWLLRAMPWLQSGRSVRAGLLVFGPSLALGGILGGWVVQADAGGWLLLFLIVSRIVLDGMTMARSWGRLALEYQTGRWDMLRLTAQTEGAILRAHYAAASASVWRLMLALFGLQTGALLTILLGEIISAIGYPSSLWTVFIPLDLIFVLGLDLLLRPRALAALGLALSASAPRAGMAAVLGSVALILFWFAQVMALGVGFFLASFTALASRNYVLSIVVASVLGLAVLIPPLLVTLFVQRVALFRLASAVAAREAAV